MATTYKSQAILRELVDLLKKEVPTLPFVTEGFDSDGNPIATLSEDATPATGEKVIVLRVTAFSYPTAKDILGLPALAFGPHTIQMCTESNPTLGAGADILDPAELLPVIVEIGRRGSMVEWYRSANGTVPAVAQMTAANLSATWRNLYWNVQSAI